MKNLGLLIGIFFLTLTTIKGQQIERLSLDTKSSQITWTGYGAIGGYSLTGSLKVANDSFFIFKEDTLSGGTLVFDMKSIDHENQQLVRHLKDSDFFEVKKYPKAKFLIQEVKGNTILGFLTIKGITKAVEVPFEESNAGSNKKINGEIAIDRTLFGINYNSDSFFKNLGSKAIKDKFDVRFSIQVK